MDLKPDNLVIENLTIVEGVSFPLFLLSRGGVLCSRGPVTVSASEYGSMLE